uniref:Uncharacterized protein n=1 Tax=Glossina pallidipes TaxID=7398 RepID=A0A1B0A8F4_GLOPL
MVIISMAAVTAQDEPMMEKENPNFSSEKLTVPSISTSNREDQNNQTLKSNDSEKIETELLSPDKKPPTVTDFILHPFIALKPAVGQPPFGDAKQASTSPGLSPWSWLGFATGQTLNSSLNSWRDSLTQWLRVPILLPNSADTPVSSAIASPATTEQPDVVVHVQRRRGTTKRPIISIVNQKPPQRHNNKFPNVVQENGNAFYDNDDDDGFDSDEDIERDNEQEEDSIEESDNKEDIEENDNDDNDDGENYTEDEYEEETQRPQHRRRYKTSNYKGNEAKTRKEKNRSSDKFSNSYARQYYQQQRQQQRQKKNPPKNVEKFIQQFISNQNSASASSSKQREQVKLLVNGQGQKLYLLEEGPTLDTASTPINYTKKPTQNSVENVRPSTSSFPYIYIRPVVIGIPQFQFREQAVEQDYDKTSSIRPQTVQALSEDSLHNILKTAKRPSNVRQRKVGTDAMTSRTKVEKPTALDTEKDFILVGDDSEPGLGRQASENHTQAASSAATLSLKGAGQNQRARQDHNDTFEKITSLDNENEKVPDKSDAGIGGEDAELRKNPDIHKKHSDCEKTDPSLCVVTNQENQIANTAKLTEPAKDDNKEIVAVNAAEEGRALRRRQRIRSRNAKNKTTRLSDNNKTITSGKRAAPKKPSNVKSSVKSSNVKKSKSKKNTKSHRKISRSAKNKQPNKARDYKMKSSNKTNNKNELKRNTSPGKRNVKNNKQNTGRGSTQEKKNAEHYAKKDDFAPIVYMVPV